MQHLSAVFFILLTFKLTLYELLISFQLFLQMEEKLAKLNLSEAETKQDNQRLARVCKKKSLIKLNVDLTYIQLLKIYLYKHLMI